MKKLTSYFLKGLIFLVPLVATFYVIYVVFTRIDSLFAFGVPGMGFLFTLLIITLIGFIASNFLTRELVLIVDRMFARLPLVKMIYSSIKDLIGAFVGEKKRFNRPVLVRLYPEGDLYVIGFVTCEDLDSLGISGSAAVYLPQSYNFAGNLIIVPKDRILPVQVDSGSVMAFIVSGGITSQQR